MAPIFFSFSVETGSDPIRLGIAGMSLMQTVRAVLPWLLIQKQARGDCGSIAPGDGWLTAQGPHASRIRGGHPKGRPMAFAKLDCDFGCVPMPAGSGG